MQTANIQSIIATGDAEALHTFLDRLTNTEFRRVERSVREEVLPQLSDPDFWTTYLHLIIYKRQAFLSAIRAAAHLAESNQLRFDSPAALQVAATLGPDHSLKAADMLLPLLHTRQQIEAAFRLFGIDDERQQVRLLIRVDTPLCYYLLLRTLAHIPDKRTLALNCYRLLLRRGTDTAYNMASIVRAYFGLSETRSQFSLRIEPYELSYLDSSYERFLHVLEGKRPRL